MSLILRLQKGTALTNEELDNNFIYLDDEINVVRGGLNNVVNVTIPQLRLDVEEALALKQDAHPKLSSLSSIEASGALFVNENVITPRVFLAGSENIVVTNANGVNGNPTINIGSQVLTSSSTHTVSNKTINGNQNTITNVSLVDGIKDVLQIPNGGFGGTTAEQARANLQTLISPAGNGLVVKTGLDSAVVRDIQTSGVGLSVDNSNGANGNPTIISNATNNNTASTIVARDSSGNFAAGTITATLNGRASVATLVDNGVYTTGSYDNPSWLVGLAGSKVTNIPNSSLTNNTITINGVTVALGQSGSIFIPTILPQTNLNTPNTLVLRDGSGNFAAGTITANLTGNVNGNITGNAESVTNGVYTTGSYNNPSWITGLVGSKVSNIPNSSLINNTITVNGKVVSLGGSVSVTAADVGATPLNVSNTIVSRDSNGDFAAGTITANLIGNASTSTSSITSASSNLSAASTRLATPRRINGVPFDGTADIVAPDNTRVAKAGDTMTGNLNMSSAAISLGVGSDERVRINPQGSVAIAPDIFIKNHALISSGNSITLMVDSNGLGQGLFNISRAATKLDGSQVSLFTIFGNGKLRAETSAATYSGQLNDARDIPNKKYVDDLVNSVALPNVANIVYTTNSYSNPAWITSLAGTKVTSIPNSSLQNSTITINGKVGTLGGAVTLTATDIGATSLNVSNAAVSRDASGNFVAGTITANLTGNVTGSLTGNVTGNVSGNASTVTNGIYTNQTYNNPTWLIGLAGSKVTSIPNSSLQNPSVTLNGTTVALGSSATITTAPTQSPGTNNTTIATTAFVTTAINSITTSQSLGIDQSWQNVKSSRTTNFDYINNTSRPIAVSVTANSGTNTLNGFVSGVSVTQSNSSSNSNSSIFMIVPPGQIYKITSNAPISIWAELR